MALIGKHSWLEIRAATDTESESVSCARTSMAAPIPEILPLQESPELHTPMELCDLSTDPISVPQDFVPHALSSRSPVDEEVPSQDMTLLYYRKSVCRSSQGVD